MDFISFIGEWCLINSNLKVVCLESQCFFFFPWHFFMGVTFDFWNLSRPFFRCHGHFFENCHGRFGNVTGINVTGRCHGHFSTFWDLSRAFSKCHGHFFSSFFYHKVKFHKIIWLKEYRLYRISSPRGSSFTAKKHWKCISSVSRNLITCFKTYTCEKLKQFLKS